MPAPLAPEIRAAIIDDIFIGELGRNAIARKHHVAAGTVTNIARAEGLFFPNDWQTTAASHCRRLDAEMARMIREDELLEEMMRTQTERARDGRETKAWKRISYKLYDNRRHHSRH